MSYNVTVAGRFKTEVLRKRPDGVEVHIQGSPFTTIIEPSLTHGATCKASGNGIEGGIAGSLFTLDIQAKDIFFNDQTKPGDNFTVVLQVSYSRAPNHQTSVVSSQVPVLTSGAAVRTSYRSTYCIFSHMF